MQNAIYIYIIKSLILMVVGVINLLTLINLVFFSLSKFGRGTNKEILPMKKTKQG